MNQRKNSKTKRFVLSAYCSFILFAIYASAHPSEPGRSLNAARLDDWKSIEGTVQLSASDNTLRASLPEKSTAAWALTTEPIWVYRYSRLKIRYRAKNIILNSTDPVLLLQPGSTGPVTPGANNLENPLARGGAMPIFLPAEHGLDNEIHETVLRVYPPIRTEQIDRIVLRLRSGDRPAFFELIELSFFEPEDIQVPILSLENIKPLAISESNRELTPFSLPPGKVSLKEIVSERQETPSLAECAKIPFRIHESHRILSTLMSFRGAITLDVHQSCREIFLLMGCDLAGTDDAFRFQPRARITQPERLIVKMKYKDGSEDRAFPYNLNRADYVVEASAVCAYAVPVDSSKTLESLRIEEYMSYGRIFLLAATINATNHPNTDYPSVRYPQSLKAIPNNVTPHSATLVVEEDRFIRLENRFYKIDLDARDGCRVKSLYHKSADTEMLHHPCPLFTVRLGGTRVESKEIQFDSYNANAESLDLLYTIHPKENALKARIRIQPADRSECLIGLQLENPGYHAQSIRLRFPSLSGLQISENIEDDFYLFPRRRADWSNSPTQLKGTHSGAFPLQFMDIYSEPLVGGLALHTRDSQLIVKQFVLEKTETESRMGVDYGFERAIELNPKTTFSTAPTSLHFHSGDWRAPFFAYRDWCKSWYKSNQKTRKVLEDVFICRRDYPIGGTGYLFDPSTNQYTLSKLIDESLEDLGGADTIDISGWAYSEKYGRVGEYRRYELGGKQNLHDEIAQSNQQDVPVGLYLEGYLIDPRSEVGQSHGKQWQIVDKNGTPKKWAGNDEIFICPAVAAWQKFMSETLYNVANDTGANALYMDQYGFANSDKTCYATDHGHVPGVHPVLTEHAMLQTVRAKLNECKQPTALYLEQTPNDVSSQYADAAFDYAFWRGQNPGSPAKLNLFRFAIPSFKIIQLFHPGIDPKAASEEDAKLCFFYGEAMWLKGRARSWFSRECRNFIRKANEIFHANKEAFTSERVEPMIPTEQPGLYANRFDAAPYSIVTLYNATPYTIQGILLSVPNDNRNVAEIMKRGKVNVEPDGEALLVRGTIHPHEVLCYRIQ